VSTRKHKQRFPTDAFVLLVASVLLWGLAGCRTSPPREKSLPEAAPTADFAIPANSTEYQVVSGESLLQILVYRGGAMARLGHNHVIASNRLEGSVYVTEDPAQTRFDVRFPVNELTIDEPEQREKAGAEFPPGVPENARIGTRNNLLSEALLDGANHPEIRLRATDVLLAGEGYDIGVEITIKDQVRVVRVPAKVVRSDGALTATGEFPLKQSELGLEPFSVAMGTLVVLDEMKVRFELTARR
jgi:polyisoprenoid-binding protein YceI